MGEEGGKEGRREGEIRMGREGGAGRDKEMQEWKQKKERYGGRKRQSEGRIKGGGEGRQIITQNDR